MTTIHSFIVGAALAVLAGILMAPFFKYAFERLRRQGLAFALIAAGFLTSMATKPAGTATIKVEPVDPGATTVAVTTNGQAVAETAVGSYCYQVITGAQVHVEWTADDGYEFPGERAVFPTNVTASVDRGVTKVVSLAEDQLPRLKQTEITVADEDGVDFYCVYTNAPSYNIPIMTDPAAVMRGEWVEVVYVASPNYLFQDGTDTFVTNFIAGGSAMTITLADDQKPLDLSVPVELVTNGLDLAGTTFRLTVGGEPVEPEAEGPDAGKLLVLPFSEVAVTYEAAAGTYFEDGAMTCVRTFVANMPVNPVAEMIEKPEAPKKPKVLLGVVAQRYPWDGKIDVQYWAKNTPNAGYDIVVTVTLPDGKMAEEAHEAKNGQNVTTFDAKAAFGEISVKGVKVKATLKERK